MVFFYIFVYLGILLALLRHFRSIFGLSDAYQIKRYFRYIKSLFLLINNTTKKSNSCYYIGNSTHNFQRNKQYITSTQINTPVNHRYIPAKLRSALNTLHKIKLKRGGKVNRLENGTEVDM